MLYRDLRRGRQTLSPADVERMVSLYDGNLRMADDAVEQLFAALREVGRWENSLVLVTSDHGEAFFEHGVQGHNTTLYGPAPGYGLGFQALCCNCLLS